jgi:hypothetical protein
VLCIGCGVAHLLVLVISRQVPLQLPAALPSLPAVPDCWHFTACSFFRDRRRVNVAMSRARHLCVVVCSIKTLRLPKAQPWGAVLANYHCADDGA